MSFDGGIPTGFKQTEIGSIPDDWDVVAFGDHYAFQNGVNADKKAYGKGIRFANVLEVITHSHLSAQQIPGQVQLSADQITAFAVRNGDVLFNRTSETQDEVGLASVYVGSDPIVFGGFVIRGRPTSDAFDSVYAGYGFRAPIVRAQIVSKGQGAVRANIGQAELRTTWLPHPPLPEQRAIAGALSDVDGLIAELEALVAKKRDLKQGAAQTLLTGETRLPGFSGDWRATSVREVTSLFAGGTPSTSVGEYWGGTVPWMSSGELHSKRVKSVRGRITDAGLANSAAKWVPIDSVLIGLAGQGKTRATAAIAKMRLTTNQSIAAIVPGVDVDGDFLFHELDARYEELRELSSGDGGRGGLNLKILGDLELMLPSKQEQTAIAAALSDMDAEIEVLEAQLAKTRDLKTGMMQDLLTGRVRLTGTGERRAA